MSEIYGLGAAAMEFGSTAEYGDGIRAAYEAYGYGDRLNEPAITAPEDDGAIVEHVPTASTEFFDELRSTLAAQGVPFARGTGEFVLRHL